MSTVFKGKVKAFYGSDYWEIVAEDDGENNVEFYQPQYPTLMNEVEVYYTDIVGTIARNIQTVVKIDELKQKFPDKSLAELMEIAKNDNA